MRLTIQLLQWSQMQLLLLLSCETWFVAKCTSLEAVFAGGLYVNGRSQFISEIISLASVHVSIEENTCLRIFDTEF